MTLQLENFGAVDSLALFRAHDAKDELFRNDTGNVFVNDFAVFRTGTFKDSMGEQHTWTTEHLAQMVSNFKILSESGRLQGIPVRDGHRSYFGDSAPGSGVGRVVGWVTDLRLGEKNVDGEQMLVADFEFTEEDAAEKFRTGTFRARSSEIGMYETNDEAMHWPTFLGFAFVDIGAVEKLFGKSWTTNNIQLSQHSEGNMTKKNADEAPLDAADVTEEDGIEIELDVPAPGSDAPPATTEHAAAPTAGNFAFRVGGQATTDFAAVQQHIDTLEGLTNDYVESTRNDYVTGLAEKGIIPATKVEDMQAFARGMSPEQYTQFAAMYDDTPANALFANHANGVTNEKGTEGTNHDSSTPDELEILKLRVEYARKSGLGEAELQKLDSFKRLQQLTAAGSSN